ncbi:hypothetical protein HYR99_07205, partial [Candidatus Poribacteria bacterium]|nr:hypothetical protein [Candidatus Poribacteria bacterium]
MKIKLPKAMRGYNFNKLFSIEMNDFEVDALLSTIFYLIRSRGKQRGRARESVQAYAMKIDERVRDFINHDKVEGFDGTEGLRLADKWIRTSMIRTSRVGAAKQKGEQIFYIRPLSFLSYKPAFPVQSQRLRNVPQFLYQIFHEHFGDRQRRTTLTGLEQRIQEAFSVGLELPEGPQLDGYYDRQTQLDTEVLAQLYYLDGFEPCPANLRREATADPAVLKMAAEILAKDIHHFMFAYKPRVPPGVLAKYLIALLNFELAIYTLKLVHATHNLVRSGSLHQEMTLTSREDGSLPPADLRFYVDVSGDRHSPSGRMAHANVNRDLEALQEFSTARLTLRTLDRYIQDIPKIKREVSSLEGSAYLERLLTYRNHPDVRASARMELRDIRAEIELDGDVDTDESSDALPPELQKIL